MRISVFTTNYGKLKIITGDGGNEKKGLFFLGEEDIEEGADILEVFRRGMELGIEHGEELHDRRNLLDYEYEDEIPLQKKSMVEEYEIPELPKGCSLVVFERCSHSNGIPYEKRFAAVPVGGEVQLGWRESLRVTKKMEYHSFMDRNSEYSFTLPNGSFILGDKVWTPCCSVEYGY